MAPTEQFHQHHRYLLAYALSQTRNFELARDLVQDTYLAALEHPDKFEQRSSLRTWLTAILKYKTYDAFRQQAMKRSKLSILTEEPGFEMFPDNYELLPVIKQVMQKLPPLWRQVFVMKDLEERPALEICRTLNLSQANYWVISHRARRSLRKSLQDFV